MSILAVTPTHQTLLVHRSSSTAAGVTAASELSFHRYHFLHSTSRLSTSPLISVYPTQLTLQFRPISLNKWIPFAGRDKFVIGKDDEEEEEGGAFWEEPDVGNENDETEKDENREGKMSTIPTVASRDSTSNSSFPHDLSDEVELLLSDEEKAIWQQNETPDLSKISTNKWNPLHTLALSQQIPIMDKLLEHGVHIDTIDKDGFTALHRAVIGKKEAVISHLLRKGADPHCKDRDGATPLHYAVQVGALQTVKLLIKYKVDVSSADSDGWTPLHIAIQSRSRDIAKVLLVNGADKTRRNKDGKTPLDICLCYGRDFKSYELAKLVKLVPHGIDP